MLSRSGKPYLERYGAVRRFGALGITAQRNTGSIPVGCRARRGTASDSCAIGSNCRAGDIGCDSRPVGGVAAAKRSPRVIHGAISILTTTRRQVASRAASKAIDAPTGSLPLGWQNVVRHAATADRLAYRQLKMVIQQKRSDGYAAPGPAYFAATLAAPRLLFPSGKSDPNSPVRGLSARSALRVQQSGPQMASPCGRSAICILLLTCTYIDEEQHAGQPLAAGA